MWLELGLASPVLVANCAAVLMVMESLDREAHRRRGGTGRRKTFIMTAFCEKRLKPLAQASRELLFLRAIRLRRKIDKDEMRCGRGTSVTCINLSSKRKFAPSMLTWRSLWRPRSTGIGWWARSAIIDLMFLLMYAALAPSRLFQAETWPTGSPIFSCAGLLVALFLSSIRKAAA